MRAFTLPVSLVYTLILAALLLPAVAKGISIATSIHAERIEARMLSLTNAILAQPSDTSSLAEVHIPRITFTVKDDLLVMRIARREHAVTLSLLTPEQPPRDAWLITTPISIPYQTGMLSILTRTQPLGIRTSSDAEAQSYTRLLTDILPPPPGGSVLTTRGDEMGIGTRGRKGEITPIKKGTPFAILKRETIPIPILTPTFAYAARASPRFAATASLATIRDAQFTTHVLKEKARILKGNTRTHHSSACDYTTLINLLNDNENTLKTLRTELENYLKNNNPPDETTLRNALTTLADHYEKITLENEHLLQNDCPSII